MPLPISESYEAWRADPNPDRLNDVVESLTPTIDYALGSLGSGSDPVMRAKARVTAARAVPKYDPGAGAALPTYVSSELRRLPRIRRETTSVIGVPERTQLDAWKLEQAEREFADTHDREPTLAEISDSTGLPIKRISKVRDQLFSTPAEEGADPDMPGMAHITTDWDGEATDMVYNESDTADRKILELRMGYGGTRPAPFGEIARRLKISPASLSRRSAKLAMKIDQLSKALGS